MLGNAFRSTCQLTQSITTPEVFLRVFQRFSIDKKNSIFPLEKLSKLFMTLSKQA